MSAKYKKGDIVKFTDRDSNFIVEGKVVESHYDSGIQMSAYTVDVEDPVTHDTFHYSYVYEINIDRTMEEVKEKPGQTAKSDEGKLQLTLVPTQIIKDIAEVRMYGNKKYGDPDNWKTVELSRYKDAAFRHFLAYLEDPNGVDEESGIPHYKHLACNIAFICAMEAEKE